MANFGLTFTFLTSNNNCCGQKDLASKIATKVYATRCRQAKKNILRTMKIELKYNDQK